MQAWRPAANIAAMAYGHPTRLQRARRPLIAAFAAAAMALLAASSWYAWRAPEREAAAAALRGRELAQLLCSQCHAIADESESPRDGAPPFRTLIDRITLDGVEDMLAESIGLGHDPMPEWTFSSGQIADLIAYIMTLEPTPG
jgi:mono/diheme cytochrome c family protein